MRVRLYTAYKEYEYGEIAILDEAELKEIGEDNYIEVGEELRVSKKDASNCSELELKIAKLEAEKDMMLSLLDTKKGEIEALQVKLNNAKEEFGLPINFDELMQELKDAKKIADYEAIQKKYKQ